MNESRDKLFSRAIGVGQLVTMLIGIATILMVFGVKSEQLNAARSDIDRLADVVSDLARTQASASVADAKHQQTFEEILRRLDALERDKR